MKIEKNKISLVIGSKGTTINGISREFNCKLNINDSGILSISGEESDIVKAKEKVESIISASSENRGSNSSDSNNFQRRDNFQKKDFITTKNI